MRLKVDQHSKKPEEYAGDDCPGYYSDNITSRKVPGYFIVDCHVVMKYILREGDSLEQAISLACYLGEQE